MNTVRIRSFRTGTGFIVTLKAINHEPQSYNSGNHPHRLACLMVIATHSCDSFYIGPGGVWQCASESDRLWISIIDSIMRAAVPLFVMTSSYLLLPLKDGNTTFFKRRFIRVLVPFAVWSCIYLS